MVLGGYVDKRIRLIYRENRVKVDKIDRWVSSLYINKCVVGDATLFSICTILVNSRNIYILRIFILLISFDVCQLQQMADLLYKDKVIRNQILDFFNDLGFENFIFGDL